MSHSLSIDKRLKAIENIKLKMGSEPVQDVKDMYKLQILEHEKQIKKLENGNSTN